ncbi:hypothetical protein SFRURICE_020619 [Spodoptera frugiperda]|nr:hypothetical protein SFRURICE_020619 [Spodoptera frugiperda]
MHIKIDIKCGRAMLRREWARSTGVVSRPNRKSTPQTFSTALITPLAFSVSIGGGDCLPSCGRLLVYRLKP